jgi:hypothetical protein
MKIATRYFCETKEQDICCKFDYNREEIVEKIMSIKKYLIILATTGLIMTF